MRRAGPRQGSLLRRGLSFAAQNAGTFQDQCGHGRKSPPERPPERKAFTAEGIPLFFTRAPARSRRRLREKLAPRGDAGRFPPPPETAKPPPLLPAEGGAFRRFPSHLRLPGRLPSGRKRGIPTAGGNPLILFFLCFFRVRFSPALPGPHPALPRGKIP